MAAAVAMCKLPPPHIWSACAVCRGAPLPSPCPCPAPGRRWHGVAGGSTPSLSVRAYSLGPSQVPSGVRVPPVDNAWSMAAYVNLRSPQRGQVDASRISRPLKFHPSPWFNSMPKFNTCPLTFTVKQICFSWLNHRHKANSILSFSHEGFVYALQQCHV